MQNAESPNESEKLAFLFRFVPTHVRSSLYYDVESLYSVTDQVTADKVTRDIARFLPKSSTIIDATACIGGNAYSFASYFREVIAIEIDPFRADFLASNMRLLGAANVKTVCNDCVKWIAAHSRETGDIHDLIFFDPPWGGPDYKKSEKVSLQLSGEPLAKIISSIAPFGRYIALKVPINFDEDAFLEETKDIIEIKHKNTQLRKMNLLLFRVLPVGFHAKYMATIVPMDSNA
jgi:16S rRNA G966 N2-methylase RsmD